MAFNQCINQDSQKELLAIRDAVDLCQWRVGDIANQNYAEQGSNEVSFAYICAAVGYYVGKSRATVQNWARAASFYSTEWRQKYNGLLTMDHYLTAMQFRDWQDRLEHAAYGGRNEEPMTVDQMNATAIMPAQSPENFPAPPDAVVSYDTAIPSVQVIGKPDNAIQTILGLIGRLVDSLGLNEERRAKVYHAMELLQEALQIEERL